MPFLLSQERGISYGTTKIQKKITYGSQFICQRQNLHLIWKIWLWQRFWVPGNIFFWIFVVPYEISLSCDYKMCKSAKVVKRLLISCEATFKLWLTFQINGQYFSLLTHYKPCAIFHISSILFQKFNLKKMFCFENVTPGAQLTQQRPRVLQKNKTDSLKNTVHLYWKVNHISKVASRLFKSCFTTFADLHIFRASDCLLIQILKKCQ